MIIMKANTHCNFYLHYPRAFTLNLEVRTRLSEELKLFKPVIMVSEIVKFESVWQGDEYNHIINKGKTSHFNERSNCSANFVLQRTSALTEPYFAKYRYCLLFIYFHGDFKVIHNVNWNKQSARKGVCLPWRALKVGSSSVF